MSDQFKSFPSRLQRLIDTETIKKGELPASVAQRVVTANHVSSLIVIQRPVSTFQEAQDLAAQILAVNIHNHPNKLVQSRPCLYMHGYDFGNLQFRRDDGEAEKELTNKAGSYFVDLLDSIVTANQKFAGMLLLKLIQREIPGVVTTTIPKTRWKTNFDNALVVALSQGALLE